jgi:prepilin-type N-terminal cleavage/methylation domain-containing protein/prepilin-type processing-associated H-X9-DG protein
MEGKGPVSRRRGFTLIELLVVIAIIGILASMVFPVFARAREAARKAVCLSNVKNVALAVQMYLADNNDTLPPEEHRRDVKQYFHAVAGGGDWAWDCPNSTIINPYLRWAVILDEYVKNRDVWQCPSARMYGGAWTIIPGPGAWGWDVDICPRYGGGWPVGWGGEVTDSLLQQRYASQLAGIRGDAAHKAFVQSIGCPENPMNYGLKLVRVQDPAWFVIVGDIGTHVLYQTGVEFAYPDMCEMGCLCDQDADRQWNWDNCPWTQDCLAPVADKRDPAWRSRQARHLGGVNLGFLDGHASWSNSERMLTELPKWPSQSAFDNSWPNPTVAYGQIKGLPIMWYPTTTPSGEDWSSVCGAPPLY